MRSTLRSEPVQPRARHRLFVSGYAERPRIWRSKRRSVLRIALNAVITPRYTRAAQTTPKTSERGLPNAKGIRTRIMIPEAANAEIRNYQAILRRKARRDSPKEMQS